VRWGDTNPFSYPAGKLGEDYFPPKIDETNVRIPSRVEEPFERK
jgi:hypothetical protein